jgi:hypothetical protein
VWIGPVERHVGEKKQADQSQLAQVKLYQTEKHVDKKVFYGFIHKGTLREKVFS